MGAWLPLALVVAAIGAILAVAAGDDGGDSPAPDQAALPTEAEEQPRDQAEDQQPAQENDRQGDPTARGIDLNNQAHALMGEGRFDAAVPNLQEAVGLLEGCDCIDYQYALFNLGSSLRQAGRPAEAIPILEQRLQHPDQRETVERELELAREAAGEGRGRGRGRKDRGEDD
jgi:tetratricopeptide (TPR) repeat protein